MKCEVHVTQLPSGEVLDAKIASCTTNDEDFRSSVVNAIFKASPLPKPADMAVFQREIEFTFEPLQ